MVSRAVAGGTAPKPPQDQGLMYGHDFHDLDGPIREPFFVDPNTTA